MLLIFMLARLISAGQVVLLYDSTSILLFYRGKVYSRAAPTGFVFLPPTQKGNGLALMGVG